MDVNEILVELKSQNVSEVKKILKKFGNDLIETGLIIITFATPNLPEYINIGYEKVKLRPYIPYPLRCRNCLKFGHTTNSCTNKKICPNCALNFHLEEEDETCNNPVTCANCTNNNNENNRHNALDKICPVFLREKEIQAIVSLEKVDRKKAIETYKIRHQNSQNTFSSVVKSSSPINSISIPNNNVNNTLNVKPRELVDYKENEMPTGSNIELKQLSPKPKTVTLLPKNTSNRNKQILKRKNNKKIDNKPKQQKSISNTDDVESEDSMSFDIE